MKLAIIGSRTFEDYSLLNQEVNKLVQKYDIDMILSGGAKGADTLAERYAQENSIPTMIYTPMYEKYGKSAPIQRNKKIIEESDVVIAFWDGVSKGTKSAIVMAEKKNGATCIIIKY